MNIGLIYFGYQLPDIVKIFDIEEVRNSELYFVKDQICKEIEIYEPHGFFEFNNGDNNTYYIVYGHEQIFVIDAITGEILKKQYTR